VYVVGRLRQSESGTVCLVSRLLQVAARVKLANILVVRGGTLRTLWVVIARLDYINGGDNSCRIGYSCDIVSLPTKLAFRETFGTVNAVLQVRTRHKAIILCYVLSRDRRVIQLV
jgi:hypothetical protein